MKIIKKILCCIIIVSLVVIPNSFVKTIQADNNWNGWFGRTEDSGNYEMTDGQLTNVTATGFTANIHEVGWGGCWGGQVYRKDISIKKGFHYNISFSIQSSNTVKFVYVKIASSDNEADSFWVECPRGKTVNVNRAFTAKNDAEQITFGVGGDFGDRIGLDTDAEYRYSVFDSQNFGFKHQGLSNHECYGDASVSTNIIVSNYKLEQSPSAISEENIQCSVFGNQIGLEWTDTVLKQKYNIYLDGEKIANSISSKSYIINNVSYGLHKVGISAVVNGKESAKTTMIVQVSGKGKIINTKTIKIKSIKAKKRSLVIKWKKRKDVTGYQIQYSLKKNFKKKAKKVKILKASTSKKTIKGLKKKKKYYVRIRSFITSYGKQYYSEWSKVKSKKTK